MPKRRPETRTAKIVRERIKELRRRRGWTQDQLCERADISIDAVTRIERGKREPSFYSLERIAAAFGVDLSALLSTGAPAPARYARTVEGIAATLDAQPVHVQAGAELVLKAFIKATALSPDEGIVKRRGGGQVRRRSARR